MELSTCPECDEEIGGQDHRHVDGIQVASDMDFSRGGPSTSYHTEHQSTLQSPTSKFIRDEPHTSDHTEGQSTLQFNKQSKSLTPSEHTPSPKNNIVAIPSQSSSPNCFRGRPSTSYHTGDQSTLESPTSNVSTNVDDKLNSVIGNLSMENESATESDNSPQRLVSNQERLVNCNGENYLLLAGVFQYVKENKTAVYFPGLSEQNRLQFYSSEDVLPFVPQIQKNKSVVLLKIIEPSSYKIQSQCNLVRNYETHARKYMQDRNAKN
ncbi:hypothetical protein QTP88_025996 [Uroleucon formosanum]